MKSVIRDISENAKQLLSTSQILGTAADNTNGTMSQVQQAVSLVVDNSSEQAKNSRNTSDHMKIMGENITETTAEVQNLDQNATFMHSSSENASATLEKLCGINEQVEQMLAQVQQQTDRTNDSVPVSYTHLDVYKRQELHLRNRQKNIQASVPHMHHK